jgi:hypothetical protein
LARIRLDEAIRAKIIEMHYRDGKMEVVFADRFFSMFVTDMIVTMFDKYGGLTMWPWGSSIPSAAGSTSSFSAWGERRPPNISRK